MEMISMFRRVWDRYQLFCCSLIFLIVGLVLFSPIFHFQFLSDDWDLIYHADRYHSFVDRFVQNDHQGVVGYSYRPVAGVYLTVLKSLFGLNPTGYHVFFVLVHILNAVLVMLIFKKMVSRWEGEQVGRYLNWTPFVVGLFFLILPSHVESVAWIAAGVDVVATFWYLLSLFFFIRYLSYCHPELDSGSRNNQPTQKEFKPFGFLFSFLDPKSKFGMTYYLLCLFFFVFGLLTKEIVVTLPIMILILLFLPLKVRGVALSDGCPGDTQEEGVMNQSNRNSPNLSYLKRGIIFIAPFIIISGIYFWMRYQTTGAFAGYYGRPTVGIDIHQWFRMTSDLLSSFISWGQMRLRISNIFYHNFHWLIVAFALVVLYIKKFYRRGLTQVFFLLFLFLISLLPVLPLGFNPLSDEGERYGYLPSVFYIMLLVYVSHVFFIRHPRESGDPENQNKQKKTDLFFLFSFLDSRSKSGMTKVVYVIFCLLIVGYFGHDLHKKIRLWQQYQDSDYQILNQLYQFADGRKIILVGLPDSYNGVQGFRNGIEEAYKMYFGESIEIVRVPVYTIDGADTIHATRITYHGGYREFNLHGYTINDGYDSTIPNQIFFKTRDKSLRLTGEKEYLDEYVAVNFFRWHYDTNRSDGVTIELSDRLLSEMSAEKVTVLLFDGEHVIRPILL